MHCEADGYVDNCFGSSEDIGSEAPRLPEGRPVRILHGICIANSRSNRASTASIIYNVHEQYKLILKCISVETVANMDNSRIGR
jgi:hypothetical protein